MKNQKPHVKLVEETLKANIHTAHCQKELAEKAFIKECKIHPNRIRETEFSMDFYAKSKRFEACQAQLTLNVLTEKDDYNSKTAN